MRRRGHDAREPLKRVANAVGYLFVVDGTNRAQLGEARALLRRVSERDASRVPIAVLLNKSDLVRTFLHVSELVALLGLPDHSSQVQAFVATSTDGLGAVEALGWLVSHLDAAELRDDDEEGLGASAVRSEEGMHASSASPSRSPA